MKKYVVNQTSCKFAFCMNLKHLVPPLAKVDLAHPVRVEWVALVRVDHHHEEA